MSEPKLPARRIFRRFSILAGNLVQIAGLAAGIIAVGAVPSIRSNMGAAASFIAGWILLYFCCHAIAHWFVGTILGIRFSFYTVGGTASPEGWPPGLRWFFQHLPFFGVQTEKTSMKMAKPVAKAIMWSSGVISSAVSPTLAALWVWRAGVLWGKFMVIFALMWAAGTLSSNCRNRAGDFAKARRSLSGS